MQARYQTASELQNRARKLLAGKYTSAISITLLFAISNYIAMVFVSFLESAGTNALLSRGITSTPAILGGSVLLYAVSGILTIWVNMMLAGMALFYLKLSSRQQSMSADLYYGYREDPSKVFAVSAGICLPQLLAMLPCSLCYTMYQWHSGRVLAGLSESVFLVRSDASAWLYAAIAFGILGLGAELYVSVLLGLAFYLMLDFPKYGAGEILTLCARKMHGNKLRFFRLILRFLPHVLLGVASFGIGLLWVYPYFQETCALFFLDLMNPKPPAPTFETRV